MSRRAIHHEHTRKCSQRKKRRVKRFAEANARRDERRRSQLLQQQPVMAEAANDAAMPGRRPSFITRLMGYLFTAGFRRGRP
ncbi:hypothetical protein LH431_11125 [Laribacter hongkongensis]|uniref:hypothetical protein n=1 Tax=Laribacter hongkongensis TaxID=168471 RepID=UPI001EFCF0CA|nr:hypothetical protein [Laribacter hongkongensis]MCG9011148.1 hypothetical protein [Laribacter hongkongensis]MCG9047222.1 hypothetical protein [Laribacter hongkongensis]